MGAEKEARQRAEKLFALTGIPSPRERLSNYPHQLSGGMRQRVMIAMAISCNPKLLIADEPTTALGVTIQAQILHLLRGLQREFRMAMILITHDLGIVARVTDRVAVMYAGQIVETGGVKDVFSRPLHPYTHGLLDCIPIPGKTQRGEFLGSIPGMVPTPVGALVGCTFRNRCSFVFQDCATQDPGMRMVSETHGYRCLLETEKLMHKQ